MSKLITTLKPFGQTWNENWTVSLGKQSMWLADAHVHTGLLSCNSFLCD